MLLKIDRQHHDHLQSTQVKFAEDVQALVKVFNNQSNPFEEDSGDLLALDTYVIMDDTVIHNMSNVLKIDEEQYHTFVNDHLVERSTSVMEPVQKNSLHLFKESMAKQPSKQKAQVTALKEDCTLFSRLYISCQSREGNLTDFFKHENQPWPPSLAKSGHMREGTKSDLLDSLESLSESQCESPAVDVKVIDGAVVVHMLTPGTSATFQDYVSDVVILYLMTQLQSSQRLDLVWDIYKDDSLKAATRETRGTGTRRCVMPSVCIPGNWQSFLRNNEKKNELFAQIATTVADEQVD